ncbi:MAG: hypothetical protein AB7T31_17680 [Gemmatimonadales bacterium]
MKRTAAATAILLGLASCVSDTAEPAEAGVIDRATFVDTYVDLRLAAVAAPDFRIPPDAREEILARHGVRGEDLVRFAETHGRDLELMNEVWAEVEARFQDSAGKESTP